MISRDRVLEYLAIEAPHPLTDAELAEALLEAGDSPETLVNLIEELVAEGDLVRTRTRRLAVPERVDLVSGHLSVTRRGFGFVIPKRGDTGDVYISADSMGGAMDGDLVIARLRAGKAKPSLEGEIIRILRRAHRTVVGTIERSRKLAFLVPDDVRLRDDIFVPLEELGGATDGDVAVLELTRYPEPRRSPEGRVIEILGKKGDPGVDITAVIRKHELNEEFPEAVLKEAAAIPHQIAPADLEGRLDLRADNVFTIDGADAKDLDDAVSIARLPGGGYRLGVHIADVSHYVREGSALDREALARGTSVYLADRVVPMLPPKLSNEICSLNPYVDRLTLSAIMDISDEGEVEGYQLVRSVIRSRARLTYEAVNEFLNGYGKTGEGIDEVSGLALRDMNELRIILKRVRRHRGSIDFDFPEAKIILDDRGRPTEVVRRVRGPGEELIEEFMLAANETVAKVFNRFELPFIYRVHERPDEAKLTALSEFLARFGQRLKAMNRITPKDLQQVLERVKGRREADVISTVILRTMKQARYFEENLGHFGLAAEHYTHFTSPIRRYPDLIVHRLLTELLVEGEVSDERQAFLRHEIPEIADQCSRRERTAMEAEREVDDLKKVELMQDKLGEIYDGIVSGVTQFGIFVELENTIEGLVHVSTLTDDYYHFDEATLALVGERSGRRFTIGQPVKVQVVKCDLDQRRIDFVLTPENSGKTKADSKAKIAVPRGGSSEKKPVGRGNTRAKETAKEPGAVGKGGTRKKGGR
ncbi:MAG: ribonuclease R [Bacillota bacterium]